MPDFVSKYQFWALEKAEKEFGFGSAFLRYNGNYYTPFSGKYDTYERAMDFLKRNGKFWKDRGIVLELFCGEVHVEIEDFNLVYKA